MLTLIASSAHRDERRAIRQVGHLALVDRVRTGQQRGEKMARPNARIFLSDRPSGILFHLLQDPVFLDLSEGVSGEVFEDPDLARALVVGERQRAEGGELVEKAFR